MRDLMMKYGITLGKRFTRSQKNLFLNEITRELKNCGCDVSLAKQKGMQESLHLMIQNPLDAKAVIISHYDTPSRSLIGSPGYFPFDPELNARTEKLNLLVQGLLGLTLTAAAVLPAMRFLEMPLIFKILTLILFGIQGWMVFSLTRGLANKLNYSRSSGAVVLIRQLAEDLRAVPEVGLILADGCADSWHGYRQLAKAYPELQNKKILMLDAVADGEMLTAAMAENQEDELDASLFEQQAPLPVVIKKFRADKARRSELGFFQKTLLISCGKVREDRRFVIPDVRTPKDYHVNMEIMQWLRQTICRWVKKEVES